MAGSILAVKRSELKYILSYADAFELKKRLAALLTRDSHSLAGPYRVKSLYFDSLDNLDYQAKLAGENLRKKIRLRIYDEDAQSAKLEWKAKEGQYQEKKSIVVSREDAKALSAGNYQPLLHYDTPEAARFYAQMVLGCYSPAVVIEYQREAFMHPQYNTRITFDSQIKSSELKLDLFDRNLPWVPAGGQAVVLEVKYNEKLLGFISQCLRGFHLINVSVSKYCIGRHILADYL